MVSVSIALVGLAPGLLGTGATTSTWVGLHDPWFDDLVDVPVALGLHDDRVAGLELVEPPEDGPVAVPGDGEVADLAGQRGVRVVAGRVPDVLLA